jgi:hypothetical protein
MIFSGGCMTQRLLRKATTEPFEKLGFSPFVTEMMVEKMVEAEKPKVIDRGAGWDLMKFFIRLANTDVRQLRRGDFLNLQEDLLKYFSLGSDIKFQPPNVDECESLQKTLSKHLYELMDKGKTALGPFGSKIVAMRLPAKISNSEERVIFYCTNFPTDLDKFYIHEFAKLLEKYGSLLSKCPHCGQIFIQLRKNAIYCDRKCQRVAVMRKIRAKQIKSAENDSMKRKESRSGKDGKTRRKRSRG